ncbi:MAG: box helicase domain protein [Verrucomicrobiales bacterium]|nr:box helicase domain protein [Verrucomicrobiales bacterium]
MRLAFTAGPDRLRFPRDATAASRRDAIHLLNRAANLKTFKALGVRDDLIQGMEELGIKTPTAIQSEAIPFLLDPGTDFIAQAQTGTGKTAAFGVPVLMGVNPEFRGIQALIVAPTRELAKQIGKQLFRFTKYCSTKIFVEVLTGGDHFDRQCAALQRPTHIVVATPGRLLDLLDRKALSLSSVKVLVMDEADEMLTLGFKKELAQICEITRSRQATWLFSATIPEGVKRLITDYMSPQAHTVRIDQAHVVNRDIAHRFVVVREKEKTARIAEFLKHQGEDRGVIFCRTKAGATALSEELAEKGYPVDVLQGDLPQLERDKVLRSFKKGRFQFLIATDVAARGIDVEGLAFVIHHQLPDQIDYYTHRSGRTGRAGRKGVSIAFLGHEEKGDITKLAKELGLNFVEMR